jgi:hypothetical protein
MSESATPESGALTVEQAIAAQLPPEPVEQDDAPAVEAEETTEPQGEDQTPEEAEAEPEEPAEAEETEAEPEPVVAAEPPKYWSKDAKDAFAKLPADLQAVVLSQEGPREEAAAKAKAEAAEHVKAAQTEVAKVNQLAQQLADFLPQALETFQARWGNNPDWVAYAQQHGAEAMSIAKAQHEAELGQLQQLAVAKQQAEAQAFEGYVKAEFQKLAEIAPDLADPEKGAERRTTVTKYLVAQGIEPAALKHISAAEMLIAEKARRWDEAQAKLQAAPKPKPAPPPKTVTKPTAAQGATSQQRTAQQIANRFAQTKSTDDAIALLLARQGIIQ